MKKVAIIQPNYIPWKGYFDLINSVDEFIVLDDVQYTKNDWRNRNLINTNSGVSWLTIPVKHERLDQKIKEVKIASNNWNNKHWKTLYFNYAKKPFFKEHQELIYSIYNKNNSKYLIDVNLIIIDKLLEYFNIPTKVTLSSEYKTRHNKTDRIVDLCVLAGASVYVSGKKAKSYLEEDKIINQNIEIEWFEYDESLKQISIIDSIFTEKVRFNN